MAKAVLAGQMRTRVTIKKLISGINENGYPIENWVDVFGGKVWGLWTNTHGLEVYDAMRLEVKGAVTLTMRYSPLVDVRCRVWWETDADIINDAERNQRAYEIVSIDNVGDGRVFLEIKLKRVVIA